MKDLREKFEEELFNSKPIGENLDQCVQIAESHAKDEAIGFVEWLHTDVTYVGSGLRRVINDENHYTLEQCYEIYQQQKEG